jgi:hypothetical protein
MTLRLRQYGSDGRRYEVLSGKVAVGNIVHTQGPAGREWWGWHVNLLLQDGGPPRGTAETLEEAKALFAAAWRAWLADADLAEVTAPPLNAGTPWTESAVADLVAALDAGDDVAEVALFLQREEAEIRAKMVELGLAAGSNRTPR